MGEREEMANALALVGSSLAFALALARVLWLWPWLALEGLAVLSVLFIGGLSVMMSPVHFIFSLALLFCWFCFRVGLPAVLAFLRWASGAELAFLRFSGLPHGWHWFLVVASACALLRWIARACAGSSGETPTVMATYDEWLAARDARPNPRQKKKYATKRERKARDRKREEI